MSKLRLEQWKGEPPDIFAMRAYIKVLPLLSDNAIDALARWIWARSRSDLAERKKPVVPNERTER